jgi:hypothetical protein
MTPPDDSLPCYACEGRFTFSHEQSSDRFICRHTLPYCPEFEAVDDTIKALRFAERCDQALTRKRTEG